MTTRKIPWIRALSGFLLILLAAPAVAGGGDWSVSQKSGHVEVIRVGAQPIALQVDSSLLSGDIIQTGRDGRAMLTRGSDYLILNASSRLTIPEEKKSDGFTRLKQWLGSIFYDVETTGKPHFEVETPLLAAVVKGTKFTVTVGPDRASVQVTEGVVEVITVDGKTRREVTAGYIATVLVDSSGVIDLTPARETVDDVTATVEGATSVVSGRLSNLVEETGGEAVSDSVDEAISNAEQTVEDTLEETVDGIVSVAAEALEESVVETVEEAVVETVEEAVVETVDEAVVETVEEAVVETVEEAVIETVEEAVVEIVEEAVEEAVDDIVEEAAEEAVTDVEDTVDDILDGL